MKLYTVIVTASLLMGALSSCSDEETKSTPDYTLSDYLKAAEFVITDTLVYNAEYQYEFGLKFRPAVAGSIDNIIVRLPETHADVRVTIWDAEEGAVLRTELVSVAEHEVTTEAIDPLLLEVDHDYMITFNSFTWYDYRRPDEAEVTYPFSVGPITILGYYYLDGPEQQMPTAFPRDYYAGDLSFTFKASR